MASRSGAHGLAQRCCGGCDRRVAHHPPVRRQGYSAADVRRTTAPAGLTTAGKVDVLVERDDVDGKTRLLRLNEPGRCRCGRPTSSASRARSIRRRTCTWSGWTPATTSPRSIRGTRRRAGAARPAKEEPVGQGEPAAERRQPLHGPGGEAGGGDDGAAGPADAAGRAGRGGAGLVRGAAGPAAAAGRRAGGGVVRRLRRGDATRTGLRTFGEVGSDDPFARWQGQLQKALGDKAAFQTAVSFARTGRK